MNSRLTLVQRIKLRLLGKCNILLRGRSGWGDGVGDINLSLSIILRVSYFEVQRQLSMNEDIPFNLIRNKGWLDSRLTLYKGSDAVRLKLRILDIYPSDLIIERDINLKHNLF